ncbi:MAG TPA: filamentous hemagglutinin N-terminal domain-containing protein [Burkholderiaceae bacterium]|nr:filamentous hemagglutinin N-terminal domain-containing protein [Burkholderiaceae bacterium]
MVVAGSASIVNGNGSTTINQASQNAVLNWQSFSIGAGNSVNFVQPNSNAVALNRVLGADPSSILGSLSANGKVFLVNPNGILFGQGAQVNVGGLVASTLNISDSDFMAGNYKFAGAGNGSVLNQGAIHADGGYVALLGAHVSNQGTISARLGTVALAAGNAITLDVAGDGLLNVAVNQGAVHALVNNGGLIQADGGQILLSAQGAGQLLQTAVNNTGILQAHTLEHHNGTIKLLGDMQSGTVNVAGTLDASAPNGGNGGFIETSAAHVQVADGARITTLATDGNTGTWLIDPTDFTIAAGSGARTGSSIGADTLSSNLNSTDVTIETVATGSEKGDIHVNSAVSWSKNELKLSAHGDININASLNGSGTAKLALQYGQATSDGTGSGYTLRGAKVNLAAGDNFSTKLGSDGDTFVYTVITRLGGAGDASATSLQGMKNKLAGNYVLGANIDASATSGWNGGAGFDPIGDNTNAFTGNFDGLGHTISGLTINRSGTDYVGLFGYTDGSAIRNLGLLGGSVAGKNNVGGLVGYNNLGTISQAYATWAVTGTNYVGGLIGYNKSGTITQVYATGAVNGVGPLAPAYAGGLAGINKSGTISQAYATGAVNSTSNVGGLVGGNMSGGTITQAYATGAVHGKSGIGGLAGTNLDGTITQAYATGAVSGTSLLGGLVGSSVGTVTQSYWATDTTGRNSSVGGGTGLTTAALIAALPSGFAPGVWGNGDNQTTPYLLGMAGNQVFNLNDLPTGSVSATNRPNLYTAILDVNQLQAVETSLAGRYVLGNDIDANATAAWNGGAGFAPLGSGATKFTGIFDGLNHTISGITINQPDFSYRGLFAYATSASRISNVGLVGGSVKGSGYTGSLVGENAGVINNSYSTANVNGGSNAYAGGLVGKLMGGGTINNSYAAGTVASGVYGGGLVGLNQGTISNSYASGAVTGINGGGLVGSNQSGVVTNSFWNIGTTGRATSAGGTGLSTAAMMQLLSFSNWNIANSGGSGAVWRIYEGHTAPLLRSFMTSLTLAGAPDVAVTYNGNVQSGASITAPAGVLGAAATGTNAGFYNGYYSTQQGYDITGGNLTINAIILNAISLNGTRVYDGTTDVAAGIFTLSGLINNEDLLLTGVGTIGSKNVGTYNVNLGTLALGDGTTGLASNYTFAGGTQTATITPKTLTVDGLTAANKVYDGNTAATLIGGALSGLVGAETLAFSGQSGAFADQNVGVGKAVTVSGITLADGTGLASNYRVSNPSGLTADIARLSSVAWVGGLTGNWFDPANWANGAVPDLANVANVVIPAGVRINFNQGGAAAPAQAGPVNVESIDGAGGLSLADGSLNVAGGLQLASLDQSGGALNVIGNTAVNSFSQSGGAVVNAGNFTATEAFHQSGGTLNVSGNLGITQASGSVVLGNITAGTLGVTAAVGDITQVAGSHIVSGRTTLAAPNGNITLATSGNSLGTTITSGANTTRIESAIAAAVSMTAMAPSDAIGAPLSLGGMASGSYSVGAPDSLAGLNVTVVGQGVNLPLGMQSGETSDGKSDRNSL